MDGPRGQGAAEDGNRVGVGYKGQHAPLRWQEGSVT